MGMQLVLCHAPGGFGRLTTGRGETINAPLARGWQSCFSPVEEKMRALCGSASEAGPPGPSGEFCHKPPAPAALENFPPRTGPPPGTAARGARRRPGAPSCILTVRSCAR